CCGYNLKKSVEELLMISSNTLEKGKAVGYDDMRKSAGKGSKMEKFPYEDCYPNSLSSVRYACGVLYDSWCMGCADAWYAPVLAGMYQREKRVRIEEQEDEEEKKEEEKVNEEEEVLAFLSAGGSSSSDVEGSRIWWMFAEEDDDYQVLRRAAKQHWDSMKQYYEAHTNLCADTPILLHVRGSTIIKRLEKQMKNLLQCWLNQGCFMFYLFWLYNLDFLSVIALRYLKLVIGADGEDRKQGKKRRLVLKLLENESIKWTESEDNPGTIYIQLDQVNPKKLSFAKK
ncbi:hypothetical protein BHM03_00038441, partial [Ensete ventricosum]